MILQNFILNVFVIAFITATEAGKTLKGIYSSVPTVLGRFEHFFDFATLFHTSSTLECFFAFELNLYTFSYFEQHLGDFLCNLGTFSAIFWLHTGFQDNCTIYVQFTTFSEKKVDVFLSCFTFIYYKRSRQSCSKKLDKSRLIYGRYSTKLFF